MSVSVYYISPAFHKDATGVYFISRVVLYFQNQILIISCTKECNLLYRTIKSFVQKNAFFCTRIHKLPAYILKEQAEV